MEYHDLPRGHPGCTNTNARAPSSNPPHPSLSLIPLFSSQRKLSSCVLSTLILCCFVARCVDRLMQAITEISLAWPIYSSHNKSWSWRAHINWKSVCARVFERRFMCRAKYAGDKNERCAHKLYLVFLTAWNKQSSISRYNASAMYPLCFKCPACNLFVGVQRVTILANCASAQFLQVATRLTQAAACWCIEARSNVFFLTATAFEPRKNIAN